MRGRKPKTAEEKSLGGNAGHRPFSVAPDASPEIESLAAPDHFPPMAKAFWNINAPMLAEMGTLRAPDRVALELAALDYAEVHKAWKEIIDNGQVDESGQQSPWVAIRNRAEKRLADWLRDFGMTPQARVRVKSQKREVKKSTGERLGVEEEDRDEDDENETPKPARRTKRKARRR